MIGHLVGLADGLSASAQVELAYGKRNRATKYLVLVHLGVEPQSECPHCGRRTLELQREVMKDVTRRARSMLEVSVALALFRQGDLDGAVKNLQSAIEFDPENNEAHYNLGEVYLQQGKIAEGITATRRAIETQ